MHSLEVTLCSRLPSRPLRTLATVNSFVHESQDGFEFAAQCPEMLQEGNRFAGFGRLQRGKQ